jgi:hypothetical protein
MATIAEKWHKCRVLFGRTKIEGCYVDPEGIGEIPKRETALALLKAHDHSEDEVPTPSTPWVCVQTPSGARMFPCTWVHAEGKQWEPKGVAVAGGKRSPPPPPPRRAPPPPPQRSPPPPPPPRRK